MAGEIQQQDQRRDAAALDGAVQPEPVGAHFASTSAMAGSRILTQLKALEPLAENAEFRARWRDIKRRNKRTRGAALCSAPASRSTREAIFDVLVKRIHEYKRQHLKVLHIVVAVSRHQVQSGARDAAARLHFRRQGGARLSSGQTHDQTDHGGGRCGQSRSGRARSLEGGVPAQFQRHQRPAHLSGGGSCRNRSRPPARRRPAPAT